MSRRNTRIPPSLHSRARNADDIGYGRPPRAHQFKPGQSGNPRGRPKGAKNEVAILSALLNRRIDVREGGRARKLTLLEAILLRIAEDALKGNTKSAAFLFSRYASANDDQPEDAENITEDDRQVLDAFIRRLETERKQKGKSS